MTATSPYPEVSADELGWLDEPQMVEVDRVMIEDLGIELLQMMENAGRNLATLIIDRFAPGSVTVLAGSGGNGGGGLVAAVLGVNPKDYRISKPRSAKNPRMWGLRSPSTSWAISWVQVLSLVPPVRWA